MLKPKTDLRVSPKPSCTARSFDVAKVSVAQATSHGLGGEAMENVDDSPVISYFPKSSIDLVADFGRRLDVSPEAF